MFDPDASNLVFALSAVLDTALLCTGAAWAARGRPVWRRLALALVACGGLFALKGWFLLSLGVDLGFGVVHVLWLDLVVALPAAALVFLVLAGRRAGVPLRLAALAALLLAPVGAYASLVEPERLQTERAELLLAPQRTGERPLRIGMIADLQCEEVGAHEREAVERLMAERPDMILLAGDFHQGSPDKLRAELPRLRQLLGRLEAPGGVFAVQGDAESLPEARRIMGPTGVRLLENEIARVKLGDRRVTIAGTTLDYWSSPALRAQERLEDAAGAGDVRLLLAHRPDVVLNLGPRSRVDLTLAGHTHGGQVQLPGVGPLTILSDVPREVGAGGLHSLAGRRIYVSRGVGVERGQAPRLRLGAVPEVSLVTLR